MIHKSIFRTMATFVAICALLTTLTFTQTGCSNASIISNIQAGIAGARDVVAAMSKSDPRIAGVQKWIDDAGAFLNAYQSTPGACADLATKAAALVDAFTVAILPLMSVSPIVAAAIVGIDVALRVIAANFHNCIQTATSAAAKLPGKARPSIAAGDSDSISAADAVFTKYLATPKLKK